MNNKQQSALSWIFKHMKKQIVSIVILVLLYSVTAVLGVVLSLLSKNLIDSAILKSYDSVVNFTVYIVILISSQILISVLCKVLIFNINTKMEIYLKSDLYSKILNKKYSSILEYHSGELMNRLTSDISIVTGTITNILPNITFLFV